jgi:hypothetical protein
MDIRDIVIPEVKEEDDQHLKKAAGEGYLILKPDSPPTEDLINAARRELKPWRIEIDKDWPLNALHGRGKKCKLLFAQGMDVSHCFRQNVMVLMK